MDSQKGRKHPLYNEDDVEVIDLCDTSGDKETRLKAGKLPYKRACIDSAKTSNIGRTATSSSPVENADDHILDTPASGDRPGSQAANQPPTPTSAGKQTSSTTTNNATAAAYTIPPTKRPLPSPDPTPPKPDWKALPKLHDRFVPRYSTAEGLEFRNPKTFSIKRRTWQPWGKREYSIFAEHLRTNFDRGPLSQMLGRPVEEIDHVFNALVVDPLYDANEAGRRGEQGMQAVMQLFDEHGTPVRFWGRKEERGAKKGWAELVGVRQGSVELVSKLGNEQDMAVEQLSDEDVGYLDRTLSEADKGVLWGQA